MHSLVGFVTAGAAALVCFQWTFASASVFSGVVNNTSTKASVGSLNTSCDNTSADCLCRVGYDGPNCTDCQNGYYRRSNQSAECIPCQCDKTGSLNNTCDRFATCPCKPGVGGKQCDQCLSGFYRFSATGCEECSCDEVLSVCLISTKVRLSSSRPSMCRVCLLNDTWTRQCTAGVCDPSEYLSPGGGCTPCRCGRSEAAAPHGTRRCDLTTGECLECGGEACPTGVPSRYRVYIIASGVVVGVVVVALAILLAVYCRRRHRRRHGHRTRLPLWIVELRRDDDDADDGTADGGLNETQELAFDDLDVMYLDDSYLMEPGQEHMNESTGNLNGRAGYHSLR